MQLFMLLVILHIASGSFKMAEQFNWEEELFTDDELLRDKVTEAGSDSEKA